jgi:thiamine biosynthesis lipoprotein
MGDTASGALPRRQMLRITAVAGVSLALGGGLVSSLIRRAALHRIRETRTQLGTLVSITVVHPHRAEAQAMVAAAFTEMERLEALLSRHRPDTPLSRLNRAGVLSEPPMELVGVLRRAAEYSALSDGAFDVTIAPLLDLYRSSFATTAAPPPRPAVQDALSLVGYQDLQVDEDRVAFNRPGMTVTLDGIAKGYVIDRTKEVLEQHGADQVLVNAGGDMASVGAGPEHDAWVVPIQDPRDADRHVGVLRLRGESAATSGDYIQRFTEDRRLHHILDPGTGESPTHTSAVTVVTPSAMEADALSTAAFVLGPNDGLRLLTQTDGVEGMIVTKEQDLVKTEGFEAIFP